MIIQFNSKWSFIWTFVSIFVLQTYLSSIDEIDGTWTNVFVYKRKSLLRFGLYFVVKMKDKWLRFDIIDLQIDCKQTHTHKQKNWTKSTAIQTEWMWLWTCNSCKKGAQLTKHYEKRKTKNNVLQTKIKVVRRLAKHASVKKKWGI